MKYKYKKLSVVLQMMCAVLLCSFLTVVASWLRPGNRGFVIQIATGTLGISAITFATFNPELYRRYIELCDNYVHFHSFRFKDINMKKAASFNVKYDDFLSLNVKKVPLIGIYAVVIKAKNLPKELTVSFFNKNYKEMFGKLCNSIHRANPTAYIDPELLEWVEGAEK